MDIDTARELSDNKHINSIFDGEDDLYLCVECKEEKPFLEMRSEDGEKGCCYECAENEEIAFEWGFDED